MKVEASAWQGFEGARDGLILRMPNLEGSEKHIGIEQQGVAYIRSG